MKRPKPGRPDYTERYLTPDQQTEALNFWKRHGVLYQLVTDKAEEKKE